MATVDGARAVAAGVVTWECADIGGTGQNPLANATFSRVTDWEGTEEQAEISPDGRFVTFVADRLGQFDVWVSQLGTGDFRQPHARLAPMVTPGNLLRSLGFNGDGSEIWFNPRAIPRREKVLMPLTGGAPRPFLAAATPRPPGRRTTPDSSFVGATKHGDPMFLADRTGADAHPIVPGRDQGRRPFSGRRAYAQSGVVTGRPMDLLRARDGTDRQDGRVAHETVRRIAGAAHTPARRREFSGAARSAHAALRGACRRLVGPWLWALDVESRVTRRVTVGLEQYMSVSASRNGRRVVATVANPTASLWRVPLRDGRVEDRDAEPYPVPTERALAPRFNGTSLFYLSLSTRGTGDGLWRVQNGQTFEVTEGR